MSDGGNNAEESPNDQIDSSVGNAETIPGNTPSRNRANIAVPGKRIANCRTGQMVHASYTFDTMSIACSWV